MSIWTHVNASIRVDSLDEPLLDEKILGEISTWDNPKPTILPKGSEGSLQYKVIQTNEINHTAFQLVVFWGDLRDFSIINSDFIIDYFNNLLNELQEKGYWIRQGFVEIWPEDYEDCLYYCVEELCLLGEDSKEETKYVLSKVG